MLITNLAPVQHLAPIIHLPTTVWIPAGKEFLYRHWPDLKGKRGSTVINNSFGQNFDRYADEHLDIVPVRSIGQSFLMAEAGRVDFVLYEKFQGQTRLYKLVSTGRMDELVTEYSDRYTRGN